MNIIFNRKCLLEALNVVGGMLIHKVGTSPQRPECGHTLNGAAGFGHNAPPSARHISICCKCGNVGVFWDGAGGHQPVEA